MARQRRKLEPISVDELLTAPGMSGFVSFLNIPPRTQPDSPPAAASPLDSSALETSPVITEVVHSSAPDTSPLDSRGPALEEVALSDEPTTTSSIPHEATTLDSRALDSSPLDTAPLDSSALVLRDPALYRRVRIQPVHELPDALTYGEAALYNALYAYGRAHSSDARVITIGVDKMSQIARLAPANCRLNCRALLEKKVLEAVAEHNFTTGRTYLVFTPEAALRRQRECGLTHVVRTRGAVFVDPETGAELTGKWHMASKARALGSTPLE